MKSYFIGILLMIPFWAQAQVEDADIAQSLLWKLEGENIQTSYIFGTIHIIGSDDFIWMDGISDYINNAEQVVLELNMGDPNLPTAFYKNIALKDTTIDKMISPKDYAALDTFLMEKSELKLADFNQVKPFAILSAIYPSLVNGQMMSYEKEFVQLAQDAGKEIIGLETVDFQMSIMDKISYEETLKSIMDIVYHFEENKQKFAQLVNAYTSQNTDVIYQYMTENLDEYKKLQSELLDNRNEVWVQNIVELAQQPIFVAVGAAHLGGDRGLLQLLKEYGIKVTPVAFRGE